jgi:hypothetical protein
MLTGERPTAGNFLFYWLVNLFSFLSTKVSASQNSLCFLLALATTYKYDIAQRYIQKTIHSLSDSRVFVYSSIFAMSLLVIMAIPIPSFFVSHSFVRGNFVPNNWYNSTIIFVFPFAILLFLSSYKQLIEFSAKRNWWILILIFLNVYLKPSYFFVFLSLYPILLLYKYQFSSHFWKSILPVGLGLVFLIIEYWSIYHTTPSGDRNASAVVFHPFYSYTIDSKLWQLPVSLIFSLFFPFLYSVLNFSRLKYSILFWYTTVSFVISLLIYLLIAESGPREMNGNFYWQVIVCAWICFFVSLVAVLTDVQKEGKTIKNKLLLISYSLHVVVGVMYFTRCFF